MFSRDKYLEEFKEMQSILYKGLEKDKNNKTLLKIVELNNNMFIFTCDILNRCDSLDIENRVLYDKLRKEQVELLNLKIKHKL